MLGGLTNYAQPNTPPRSNLEWFALNTAADTASLGNVLTSGTVGACACPVDDGTAISRVTIFTGTTAAGTPTHSFAAIYGGTGAAPALLGQSIDGTTTAIGASAAFTFTINPMVTATTLTAPAGFVYVALSVTANSLPSAVAITTIASAGAQYQWQTASPLFYSANFGSAVAGTAPATITGATKVAAAPVVVLT